MSATFRGLAAGLWVLAFACGGGPSPDPPALAGGGHAPLRAAPPAARGPDGGSAEIPALTEDELRRRLDALEQEIDDH